MFAIVVRPGGKVVGIAGDFLAAAVPDLHAELLRNPGLTIDCSELRRVDHDGAAYLKCWQRAGGTLVGVSRLLALTLEAETVAQSSTTDDRSVTR